MSPNPEDESARVRGPVKLYQGGCGFLGVSFGMSLVSLTALRIFVGPQLTAWWRDKFGDPIFRVIARMVILVEGDTVRFVFLCGLGLALFLWAVRVLPAALTRASVFQFRGTSPQSVAVDTVTNCARCFPMIPNR
jgi:hypothetical protein